MSILNQHEANVINQYQVGDSDQRPWGKWTVLDTGKRFAVKRIEVNCGAKLSLQLHRGRCERWTIVQGEAAVTIADKIIPLKTQDSVFIPLETKHRIENTGQETLIFIEVQMGENLDENDIVRFEDDYGRSTD